MKKYFPLILLILALISLVIGAFTGPTFLQSRGSILCLSCMGLEENEDF
ncbi:MAG: hypothetical protein ACP5HI_06040 [Caldimicrobium sp.]|jgi:hypothetical protein